MDRNTHKNLLDHYLKNGGDAKKVKLISAFSSANHAKLKYFIKQLNIDLPEVAEVKGTKTEEISTKTIVPPKQKNSIFSDLISNYPKELHSAFKMRYEHWLEACSIKIQLNDVDIRDEKKALEIQWLLMNQLDAMDKCQRALEYYKVNKRVLETETKATFENLTPMELIKRRNNLRSSITKRTATMKRMEKELPDLNDPKYNLKLHLLNRKKEEIQKLENMVSKLDEMISE
jgi:hypothetical protein